jgi:hypothetical protein
LVVGNEKGDDYLVRVLASQGRAVTPDQVGDKIIFDVGAAN